MLDSRPKGHGFEPHRRHCVVSLSKNINPSLVLVQPRKTCCFISERLLMERKESNQTNKQNKFPIYAQHGEYALKGEVGGHALNNHGNYIVDHGKSWKNYVIVFLNFCGNPALFCLDFLHVQA